MYHPNLSWFELTDDLAWYHDPGHGWLAVPLALYADGARYASSFSFFIASDGRRWALIEEDVDAGRFLRARPEIDGSQIKSHHLDGAAGEQLRALPRGEQQ